MRHAIRLVEKLITDDRGAEVFEYALIAGLIIVAVLMVIGTVVANAWATEPKRRGL